MKLWIHLTVAVILTVSDFTQCHLSENLSNMNDYSGGESSENLPVSSSSSKVDEFMYSVPEVYRRHFTPRGNKVAFQPTLARCENALKWLEETYKRNITIIEKLMIYNAVSCPPEGKTEKFCGRNGIGHTRWFNSRCLQCAKGCKDILHGGTRYISRDISDCRMADKECKKLSCLKNGKCVYSKDEYRCHCQFGYEGRHCTPDIDECISCPCQNGASCLDKVNGYSCTCSPGYEGINCENDINECISSPCQNGATCRDRANAYICSCSPGYEGLNCENDTKECISSPCQNGATCNDKVNGYICSCSPGYAGLNCEYDINECISSPCRNGATCVNKVNQYMCSCLPGYDGINCENGMPQK